MAGDALTDRGQPSDGAGSLGEGRELAYDAGARPRARPASRDPAREFDAVTFVKLLGVQPSPYTCMRCSTRYAPPAARRSLSVREQLGVLSEAVDRVRHQGGSLPVARATARRLMLARIDDDTYQAFVRSFHFCRDCRQLVCPSCWSASHLQCLTCLARSLSTLPPSVPAVPRPKLPISIRMRYRPRPSTLSGIAALALFAAITLTGVEVVSLLYTPGPSSPAPTHSPATPAAALPGSSAASPGASMAAR